MTATHTGEPDPGGDFFSASDRPESAQEGALLVDVAGFEGPLDLLLALARTHKLDLTAISMLELAEQYLAYVEALGPGSLETAADYLVMAAWLAFLKSKLLLPREVGQADEPSGAELAARLAFRLQRLAAMRDAAARLMTRDRLGVIVVGRGAPEAVRHERDSVHAATLHDLVAAYAGLRQRTLPAEVRLPERVVWSIREARERLERLLGETLDWAPLETLMLHYLAPGLDVRGVLASSFGASLELAREGEIELAQTEAFAPLYLRRRHGGTEGPAGGEAVGVQDGTRGGGAPDGK
ncbi:MAG: segregation/condensation protein A [Rhizobiales bacterium]|nr:segregation/condensation protein A [Hyphomicrobiales bacterium]